jgi:hypothetical protein
MTRAGVEVGEGHSVGTAHLGLEMMHPTGEAVRRQPFDHGVGIDERAVNSLRLSSKNPVETDSVGGGAHDGVVMMTFFLSDERTELIGTREQRILGRLLNQS